MENGKIANSPNRENGAMPSDSRFSTFIFIILLFIPLASTVAYGAVDPQAIGILAVLSAVICVLWIAVSVSDHRVVYSTNFLQVCLAGLIAIGLVQLLPLGDAGIPTGILDHSASSALSVDPFATRQFVVRLAICLVFFSSFLVFVRSRDRVRRVVFILISFGTLMAFFGIIQRLAQPEAIYGLRPTPQAIPFGSYVNQHHFASLMVMISGLAISVLVGSAVKRDKKPLLYFAVVMMGLAIVFTSSRGGMLSYLGVIGFTLIASFVFLRRTPETMSGDERVGSRRLFATLAGGAALLIVGLGLIIFLGAGDGFLRGIGLSDTSGDVTSGRSHFWWVAGQIFLANPVIGTGLDTFGVAFTEFDTRSGMFRVEQAHNDYLQALTDAGIIGFLVVVSFVVLLFRPSIGLIVRAEDKFSRAVLTGALAGCFGVVIHSFFDFPLRTTSNGFVFLMLAALATTAIPAADRSKERSEQR